MFIYFTIYCGLFYLLVGRLFRNFAFNSLINYIATIIFTFSFIFYNYVFRELDLEEFNFYICINNYNTLGYFIGDTINIFFEFILYKNKKKICL